MEPLPWYRVAASPAVMVALVAYALWKPNVRAQATLLGAAAMCGFGVIMDQFSARLCPEYFTVLHNPIPGLTEPTLVGIVWGVLGAAGGGIVFGYVAGLFATLGSQPQLTARELRGPMLMTIGCIAVVVALTGVTVWRNACGLHVQCDPIYALPIPPERQIAALTVACYHMMAYMAAVVASIGLCVWIVRERARRAGLVKC